MTLPIVTALPAQFFMQPLIWGGAAVAGLLAVTQATALSATDVTYAISSATATPVLQCNDFGCSVIGYDYTGPGTQNTFPPGPPTAQFHLTFSASRFFPPSPCRMKSGTGTFDVTWSDATTSSGTFTFKARDSRTLSLSGAITSSTSTFYPAGPPVRGFVTHPPNPCLGGSTSGALTFSAS
jgi:hypothetical protein